MAAKARKGPLSYRMWRVGDEDRVVIVKMPERIVMSAYGTLSNASRRGATLSAQGKVVQAFVQEYTKQYGPQIGDAVTWKTLKVEKIQPVSTPRR